MSKKGHLRSENRPTWIRMAFVPGWDCGLCRLCEMVNDERNLTIEGQVRE
jgi:hypothetical protein